MSFIIGWLVKKFGIGFILIAIDVIYIGIVVSFYIFIFNVLLEIYTVIQNFFTLFSSMSSGQSGGGCDVITLFSSLLNVIGFIPALQDTFPLISSALVFVLTKYLYKTFKEAYGEIVTQLKRSANLYL